MADKRSWVSTEEINSGGVAGSPVQTLPPDTNGAPVIIHGSLIAPCTPKMITFMGRGSVGLQALGHRVVGCGEYLLRWWFSFAIAWKTLDRSS